MGKEQDSRTNQDLWRSAITNFKIKNYKQCLSDFEGPISELENRLKTNPRNMKAAKSLAFACHLSSRCHMHKNPQELEKSLNFALRAMERRRSVSPSNREKIVRNYNDIIGMKAGFNWLAEHTGKPPGYADKLFKHPWVDTEKNRKGGKQTAVFNGPTIKVINKRV
ncbi:MAG: hypothetical protein PHS02_00165 [Candidatus ainarchaeum sp.]|nr:hypothetical protein [Candidatus ainarchaeum sp.]